MEVTSVSLYIERRLNIFYKNGKNVGMAQKGQKQEGMSCGEVFAVCGFYTQGYCTISLHLLTPKHTGLQKDDTWCYRICIGPRYDRRGMQESEEGIRSMHAIY